VDGFRVRPGPAPPLVVEDREEVVFDGGRRDGLAGDLGRVFLSSVVAGLVESRAGVEARTGRVAVLAVVFKDARLGLWVAVRVAAAWSSFVAAALVECAGLEVLSVLGLAVDLGAAVDGDMVAELVLPVWTFEGRLLTAFVGFCAVLAGGVSVAVCGADAVFSVWETSPVLVWVTVCALIRGSVEEFFGG
jgi:hypothetical protein